MESVISLLKGPLLEVIVTIAILLAMGVLWMRAGSIYFVLDRLWKITAGKEEVKDTKIKEFMHDIHELERFRYMYRVNVDTKKEAYKLIEWMQANSLGMRRVQRANRWIEINTPEIVHPPKKSYLTTRLILLMMCGIIFMFLMQILALNYGIYKMKESEVWFLAGSDKIISWSIDLDKSNCNKQDDLLKDGKFTKNELNTLCEWIKTDDIKSEVAHTVKMQRELSLVFLIAIILWGTMLIIEVNSAAAANEIKKKLVTP